MEDEDISNKLTFPCCSLVPPGSAPCKGQHSEETVPRIEERKEENSTPVSQSNGQNIPVLASSPSNHDSDQSLRSKVVPRINRQYNCYDCDYKGPNSKSLLKHVRDTLKTANPHLKHDDLKEQCYTCKEIYANFDDLMMHRKSAHAMSINQCRFVDLNTCKFGDACWYSHQKNDDEPTKVNFQQDKESFPPDLVQEVKGVTEMITRSILMLMQRRESGTNRSPGH